MVSEWPSTSSTVQPEPSDNYCPIFFNISWTDSCIFSFILANGLPVKCAVLTFYSFLVNKIIPTPASNSSASNSSQFVVGLINVISNVWLGSMSAALSCLVYPTSGVLPCLRGRSAGSFPEQRLVIEPNVWWDLRPFLSKDF